MRGVLLVVCFELPVPVPFSSTHLTLPPSSSHLQSSRGLLFAGERFYAAAQLAAWRARRSIVSGGCCSWRRRCSGTSFTCAAVQQVQLGVQQQKQQLQEQLSHKLDILSLEDKRVASLDGAIALLNRRWTQPQRSLEVHRPGPGCAMIVLHLISCGQNMLTSYYCYM